MSAYSAFRATPNAGAPSVPHSLLQKMPSRTECFSGVLRLGAVVTTIGPRIEGLGFNSLQCYDRWLLRAVAPARLGQAPRSSDRRSAVVLNVARRHRASQTKPGRQGAWQPASLARRGHVPYPIGSLLA